MKQSEINPADEVGPESPFPDFSESYLLERAYDLSRRPQLGFNRKRRIQDSDNVRLCGQKILHVGKAVMVGQRPVGTHPDAASAHDASFRNNFKTAFYCFDGFSRTDPDAVRTAATLMFIDINVIGIFRPVERYS